MIYTVKYHVRRIERYIYRIPLDMTFQNYSFERKHVGLNILLVLRKVSLF